MELGLQQGLGQGYSISEGWEGPAGSPGALPALRLWETRELEAAPNPCLA